MFAICIVWSKQAKILYSQVASKLLSDGLLLTALELHTELLETGRELPRLICRTVDHLLQL